MDNREALMKLGAMLTESGTLALVAPALETSRKTVYYMEDGEYYYCKQTTVTELDDPGRTIAIKQVNGNELATIELTEHNADALLAILLQNKLHRMRSNEEVGEVGEVDDHPF